MNWFNNYNATTTTTIANGFDVDSAAEKIASLRPYVILIDIVYVLTVIFAKEKLSKLISNKVLLRDISLLWNFFNALFSIFIVCLLLPESIYALFVQGFDYAVCTNGSFMTGRLSGLGMYLFVYSKFWELGDTFILMLRGRPIIFLHYYHHALVLIQVVFTYPSVGSLARLATLMNVVVHSIMYSYFAFGTMYASVRRYAKFVTIAQLIQFVLGCYGIIYARNRVNQGEKCDTNHNGFFFHMFIYASFLGLFAHFFYKNFNKSRASSADVKRKLK